MNWTPGQPRNPEPYVLDSWPFLELMLRSVRLPRFYELFKLAQNAEATLLMREMNLGEIFYRVAKERGEARAQDAVQTIVALPVEIITALPGDVMKAARLKAQSTLFYADCFCALAPMAHDATVVTGDPDFLTLEKDGLLRVEWLGA